MPDRDPRVVRRFVLVAVVLPIVVVALGAAVQLGIASSLPDPVAIHWGADGQPDGYASPAVVTALLLAVGLGLPLLLAASTLRGLRQGGGGPTYRLLGAVALGVSVYLAVLTTWTLVMQAGLADASDCPSVWPAIAGSFVVALAAGAVGWAVQPHEDRTRSSEVVPASLDLRPGERAVWLRTTTTTPVLTAVVVGAVVVLLLVAVGAWLATPTIAAAGLTAVALLVGVVAASTIAFRVRVDEDGLTVRSLLGVPRFRVALDDVADVRVATVASIGDFGGYGLRGTPKRFGVILHRGDAISVTRRNGHEFVVTVDGAAGGAALLRALVERSAAGRRTA